MARVGAERHLPALPAARRHAHLLQRQRHQPGGDVLARGDHRVVLARVVEERGLAHPADQLVGLAGHGRDDDGHVVAALDLALDLGGGVADAVEVGDGGAAEFHHQTGHGPRPADGVGRALLSAGSGGFKRRNRGPLGESGGRALQRLGKSARRIDAVRRLQTGLPVCLGREAPPVGGKSAMQCDSESNVGAGVFARAGGALAARTPGTALRLLTKPKEQAARRRGLVLAWALVGRSRRIGSPWKSSGSGSREPELQQPAREPGVALAQHRVAADEVALAGLHREAEPGLEHVVLVGDVVAEVAVGLLDPGSCPSRAGRRASARRSVAGLHQRLEDVRRLVGARRRAPSRARRRR